MVSGSKSWWDNVTVKQLTITCNPTTYTHEKLQLWKSKCKNEVQPTCLCSCYAMPTSVTCCFGWLHVLFPSLFSLGNVSYRTITRFPWPLSTLKAYMYKNTVVQSNTIKIGLQCLLEARMAHTLAAGSLWQSTVTWQHCPKMFYNGWEGWRTNHTTRTIIPASNSFCLCNFMRSKRMTQKGNVASVMFWDCISSC